MQFMMGWTSSESTENDSNEDKFASTLRGQGHTLGVKAYSFCLRPRLRMIQTLAIHCVKDARTR